MFLGIDVGGTTLSLGLVSGNTLVKSITAPSFKSTDSLQETYNYLKSLISKIITPEVSMIGIGVPCIVDSKKGIAYNAVNIPAWKEAHLGEVLGEYFGIPVKVNNDANCYSLGAAARVGNNEDIIVGVTLGTGVGTGVVVNGKILNGRNTGVGELGSIPYNGRMIEEYCSKSFFAEHGVCPVELSRKASMGDASAIALFEEYGRNLGVFMSIAVMAYDPSVIVIGGGLSNNFKYFEKAMKSKMSELVPSPESLDSLRFECLSDVEIAIIGASLL